MRTREISAGNIDAKAYDKNPFDALKDPRFRVEGQQNEAASATPPEEDPVVATPQPRSLLATRREVERPQTAASPEIVAKASSNLGPEWVRQELPSLSVFYTEKEIFLRPFEGSTILSKIYAAHRQKSFTALIDALNNQISVDIRTLTPPDLTFVMYWIRDNSYVRSPQVVEYLTRYNNEIEVKVDKSQRKIREIQMGVDEYEQYQEFGLVMPTVRDQELLEDADMDADRRWQVEYAQYVALPVDYKFHRDTYLPAKVAAFDALIAAKGLEDTIQKIDEFSASIEHGVDETIDVVDPQFKPEAAATFFENLARDLVANAEMASEAQREEKPIEILRILEHATMLKTEAAEIRAALANGERVTAKKETVAISINATDFFPRVR